MNKRLILILLLISIFISGCAKTDKDYNIEDELSKFDLKEIILDKITMNSDKYLYAIAIDNNSKEVYIKYEIENQKLKIIDLLDYDLSFSYNEVMNKLNKLEEVELKNATLAIIKHSDKIGITDKIKLKEVLKINNTKKFNVLVFHYKIGEDLNKFVIAYDLGDYYLANETTEEIYYPIYCKYDKFP